jgi:hypothetical protein
LNTAPKREGKMAEYQPEIEKLKVITGIQQSEASIHWTRNNIFLICSSILIIALSQFHQRFFQLAIAGLGFTLNFAWLLIQYRSSKYILHWKTESRRLRAHADDMPDIFPQKLKGIEMRKVVFILPIAFMVIWALIFVFSLTKKASVTTSWIP